MAFSRELQATLAQVIKDYDVQGAIGCQLLPEKTATLAKVVGTILCEDRLSVIFDQLKPEGFGQGMFWNNAYAFPRDEVLNKSLTILWDACSPMPSIGQHVWFRNIQEIGAFPEDYIFDHESFWTKAKVTKEPKESLHHLEMFSGAFGGWPNASRFVQKVTGAKIQTVALEVDPKVAKAFAIANHACYVKPDAPLPPQVFADFDGTWVVCTDIKSDVYMKAASEWGVDFASISSPCQPWSGASSSMGFLTEDGQAMIHAVLQMRWLRPAFLLMENVSGFARHEQKHILLKTLRMCGYKMIWDQVADTQSAFGFVRGRWIALAVRCSDEWKPVIHTWNSVPEPIDHSRFAMPWDVHSSGLALSPQAIKVANEPTMLRYFGKKTETPIMQYRICDDFQVLPTFMALYGSQHEISETHLKKYGFFRSLPKRVRSMASKCKTLAPG